MGPSIGLVSSWMSSVWMEFTLSLTVAAPRVFSVGSSTDTSRQMARLLYSLWLVLILTRLLLQP